MKPVKLEDLTKRLTDTEADAIEGIFDALVDSDGNHESIKPGCEAELAALVRTAHLVIELPTGPVGFWRLEDLPLAPEPWIYIDLSSQDNEPFLGMEFGAEEFDTHMNLIAEEMPA